MTAVANAVARITVNLPTRVWDLLTKVADEQKVSKTEALRRAISMWAFVSEETKNGEAELLLRRADGTLERIHFTY